MFVCASSCIKQYVQPSYGCRGMPVVARMCVYTGGKIYLIIESVDSISRDEPDSPLTQYITNAGISRARYAITLFKHHHRVLLLISNRISV